MTIRSLHNQDQQIIRPFLEQDRLSNLYLIDLLDRQGIDFWGFCRWTGFFENSKLIALNVDISCLDPNSPCKMSVPVGDPSSCVALGENTKTLGSTERILSELAATDGFYQGLGKPDYRLIQKQRLLWTDRHLPGKSLSLRPANIEELSVLVTYTAQMRIEDEEYDPRERDQQLWRKTVQALIAQRRILVGESGDEICFVVEVGTRCEMGAQIGSTFVPQRYRKQGFGSQGMRGAVEFLLPSCTLISLLAHEGNIPAMACHRRAGFTDATAFRLVEMI